MTQVKEVKKIITSDLDTIFNINNKINFSLSRRIDQCLESDSGVSYNNDEIRRIKLLIFKLFPKDFSLNEKDSELYRRICMLSQFSLNDSKIVKSHRKIIGPVIYFVKKISKPFVTIHLKETINSLSELLVYLIYAISSQKNSKL